MELEEEWRTCYTYHYRTNCPRPHTQLFLPEDAESDDNIEALSTPPLTTQRERSSGPRRSSRITSGSTSTSLSPLVEILDVTGPAPFPMNPSSPTLSNHVLPPSSAAPVPISLLPRPPNNRFTITIPPYVLPAGQEPDFSTFEEIESYVNDRRCPDILSAEDLFSVEGDSVTDAATGLVVALMNVYGAKDVPLCAQRLQPPSDPREAFTGLIQPNDATLEHIFYFQHWMFRG